MHNEILRVSGGCQGWQCREGGRGSGKLMFKENRVSVGEDEKVTEMVVGDGCT